MSAAANKSFAPAGLTGAFLLLAIAFYLDVWGRTPAPIVIPSTPPEFTNTATVRMSAAELFRTGGDTSGMSCYSCHDPKKTVVVNLDTNGNIVLPEEHKDLVLRHGRHSRNDYCFNCHDQKNLESLRVREGQAIKLTESSQLCGSCHGPTYRDWEIGIHGRVSGFWDRKRGEVVCQDCTSCHDPHAPAFAPMKPGPGPNLLHPKAPAGAGEKERH